MTEENRHFYAKLFRIAIPITIQNGIMSSLNLVDTIMIGQLGAVEVAAVGLANRFYFILILILFGMSSGAAMFTAQFWGKGDLEHIGKVMAIALIFGLCVAFGFSAAALIVPEQIMGIFTTDPDVTAKGTVYFQVVAFSYMVTAITLVYSFVLRSLEEVKLPMFASTGALLLNTLLNYGLILGNFGFPALGVRGAAIATVIARTLEVTSILIVTYLKRYPVFLPRDLLHIPAGFVKQFFAKTAPVVANEFVFVMGMTVLSIVYGRMGTSEIAAVNIVLPVERVTTSLFFGLGNAAAVMIGNNIGAGREDLAFSYATRITVITILGAILGGIGIFLSARGIVSFYNIPPEVHYFAVSILMISSFFIWIRVFNMLAVIGIFRGGGDTTFAMIIEIFGVWGIGVPLALLGAFVFTLPVYYVFLLASLNEVVRMILGGWRFYSRKWIHNLVRD